MRVSIENLMRLACSLSLTLIAGGCAAMNGLSLHRSPKATTATRLMVARMAEKKSEFDQAEQQYLRILETEPGNATAHHRLAMIADRMGDEEEIEPHFRDAMRLDPSNLDIQNDFAYWLYLQARPEEAEEIFRGILEKDDGNRRACNNLALIVGHRGDTRECYRLFQRGGTDAQAHANLAFILAQRGELDEAQRHYDLALTLDPKMRSAVEALSQLDTLQKFDQKGQLAN